MQCSCEFLCFLVLVIPVIFRVGWNTSLSTPFSEVVTCILKRVKVGVNTWAASHMHIYRYNMHQERRESKTPVLFWPEVPRFEVTLGLILVPAIGLDGDCRWCHKGHLGQMANQVCALGSPTP